MEELLQKSSINHQKLKRIVHKYTAHELTRLSEPCYYPEVKKFYFEFLHASGLTNKDMKAYVKRFYKGTPASGWYLQKDPQSNLYIFLMHYFLTKKDRMSYASMMTFFCIRYYANLIRRQIKYCNIDVFKYTLENLAKTHLFSREKTISNAIFFISKEMQRKFTSLLSEPEPDPMLISKFIQESRHRISQSIKSFAETYYRASKEGVALKTEPEVDNGDGYQYQSLEKSAKIVDTVVKKLTIYKVVDRKAIEDAKRLTKVSTSIATLISNQVIDIKYADNIRIVLELFVKDLKDVETMCGDSYFSYVKSLMGIKRTTTRVYFKQQIEILLVKIVEDINFADKFETLTNQTQFLIKSYLAYYITMVMRNTVC